MLLPTQASQIHTRTSPNDTEEKKSKNTNDGPRRNSERSQAHAQRLTLNNRIILFVIQKKKRIARFQIGLIM